VRVLHVIPSVSAKHGGPSFILPVLARALIDQGIEVVIATTDDDGPRGRLDVALDVPVKSESGATIFYFRKNTEFYKSSFQLTRWLLRHIAAFDLVHIHALFSYSSVAAAFIAKRQAVPYIVRPLGVLNRWGMENRRRTLKRFSLRWIEMPILRGASAIHYTSRAEQLEAAAADPAIGKIPSAVIPLPLEISASDETIGVARFREKFPEIRDRSIVLFLSRIDPKKGLELLLSGFVEVVRTVPRAILVLAGAGDDRYLALLRTMIEDKGLRDHVLWAGFLQGEDKAAAFGAATVYVLPSYSENFGIAAAEALAAGVPTVVSDQVALAADIAAANAGIVVPCEAGAIANAVVRLLGNADLREDFRRRARTFAAASFSLEAAGRALRNFYELMVNPQSEVRSAIAP
jgi:glycosyltransferase involved in cell wall biosynthesis